MRAADRGWSDERTTDSRLERRHAVVRNGPVRLTQQLAFGRSIEEVAGFLCRAGTVEEVKRKAAELELLRSKSRPPASPAAHG
jgi:hypothetical protein